MQYIVEEAGRIVFLNVISQKIGRLCIVRFIIQCTVQFTVQVKLCCTVQSTVQWTVDCTLYSSAIIYKAWREALFKDQVSSENPFSVYVECSEGTVYNTVYHVVYCTMYIKLYVQVNSLVWSSLVRRYRMQCSWKNGAATVTLGFRLDCTIL